MDPNTPPSDAACESWLPHERAMLLAARRSAVLAVAGFLVALTLAALLVLGVGLPDGFESRGRLEVAVVLLLLWAWALWRPARRLLVVQRDLREGGVATLRGPAVLHSQRGIGLIAPSRPLLMLQGRSFPLPDAWFPALGSGRVLARVSRQAGVLLSLQADEGSVLPSDMEPVLGERDRVQLALLARGLSDKLIARQLGLTPATIRTYNSQLFQRLGVSNRQDAVATARARGLIPVD